MTIKILQFASPSGGKFTEFSGLTGAATHLPEKRNKNAGVETKIELVEDKEDKRE